MQSAALPGSPACTQHTHIHTDTSAASKICPQILISCAFNRFHLSPTPPASVTMNWCCSEMLADQCSLYSLSAQFRSSCSDAIVSSIHTTNPSPNAPAQQAIVPRVVRRYAPPPPMAVRLAADLRPSADGSAVRTWLSCRQPACRKPRAAAHLGSCAKGQKDGRIVVSLNAALRLITKFFISYKTQHFPYA